MTKTSSKQTRAAVIVDRKRFQRALERIGRIVPRRSVKPILECVHLQAAKGDLQLQATDLEVSVLVRVPAEGTIPACLVNCGELLRRVKASKNRLASLLSRSGSSIRSNGSIRRQPSAEVLNRQCRRIASGSTRFWLRVNCRVHHICRSSRTQSPAIYTGQSNRSCTKGFAGPRPFR